ncbi:MAG: tetratricopeptide repeat protein, partial [Pseudomonadota bacterium]
MSDTVINPDIKKGLDLLDSGKIKEAIVILLGYWNDHKGEPDSWFYLGDALAENGQLGDAIERYREGLKLAPEDVDALTTLGDMLFEAGKHKDAIACYKKVLDIDPKDADALVSIGLVHGSQERGDEAISAFEQALELEPDNVFAWNALGDALYGKGDVEGA